MTGAIAELTRVIGSERVHIRTSPCVVCGKQHEFVLSEEKFTRWQNGEHIQNVFPELTADEREILISGTCGPCWDELWQE